MNEWIDKISWTGWAYGKYISENGLFNRTVRVSGYSSGFQNKRTTIFRGKMEMRMRQKNSVYLWTKTGEVFVTLVCINRISKLGLINGKTIVWIFFHTDILTFPNFQFIFSVQMNTHKRRARGVQIDRCLPKNFALTNIVNLPVSSSERSGSIIGSSVYSPSCCRINSCCSNSATARCTSNLRANRNFNAVAGDIFLRSQLRLMISVNSLTACNARRWNEETLELNACNRTFSKMWLI